MNETSTDAINGSQLYAVTHEFSKLAKDVAANFTVRVTIKEKVIH